MSNQNFVTPETKEEKQKAELPVNEFAGDNVQVDIISKIEEEMDDAASEEDRETASLLDRWERQDCENISQDHSSIRE